MTQRLRWAHGMLQVFMLKNPLFQKGLNLGQRLSFFNMVSYWLFAYMRIMFLLGPSAYLLFDLKLFDAQPSEILLYVVPSILSFLIFFDVVFGKQRWFLVSEVYETLQCFFSIRTVFSVLINPKKGSFNVTPKDENIQEDFISPLSFPVYVLVVIVCAATIKGIVTIIADPSQLTQDIVVTAWSLFNSLVVLGALGALTERKQVRNSTRFAVEIPASIQSDGKTYEASIVDLSVSGMRMLLPQEGSQSLSSEFAVNVYSNALQRQVNINCSLVGQHIERDTGHIVLRIAFDPKTLTEEQEIVALSYGDSERWRKVLVSRNEEFGFSAGLSHFIRRVLPAGISHVLLVTKKAASSLIFLKKRKGNV